MPKVKGPSWNDVHDPKNSNRIESRQINSYTRKIVEHGRTRIRYVCPFCKATVEAYLWSLSGAGKRCLCGALTGSGGATYHFADRGVV